MSGHDGHHHHHDHFGNPDATRLRAIRCGPIAQEILGEDGEIVVIAVFDRSFYLACPRGIVCIGSDIGAGPINVEMQAAPHDSWETAGIRPDMEGRIEHGVPYLTENLALDISGARIWEPPVAPSFDKATAAVSLARLKAQATPLLPADGLAALVLTGKANTKNIEAQMAAASLAELRNGLVRSVPEHAPDERLARAATLLVGLGPGLTPSGDDVLAGVMLALSIAGRTTTRDALWHALTPELDALTVPISAMHLSAAADGMASELMHALLEAILTNSENLGPSLRAAARTGHTSGWDTIAGIVLGLEAVLASM